MKRLKNYILRYLKDYIAGGIFIVLASITSLFLPWILKHAIDDISRNISYTILLKYVGFVIGISIVGGIFRFLMRRITISASRQIEYDLRNDYFKHLQKLPLSFYDQNNTGDLMSRGTNDLNDVRMLLGPGIMYTTETLITFVFALIMMIIIDTELSLIAISPLIILSLFISRMGSVLHKNYRIVQEKTSNISRLAQEYISGIKVIKAFTQEDSTFSNFENASHLYLEANLKVAKIWGVFFPIMFFMAGLSTLIILFFGGKAVILQRITLGEFVAFNAFLAILIWPMMALGWAINLFQAGISAMKRINYVLDQEPSIIDKPSAGSIKITGKIEFRNLTFSYTGNSPVLKNINLKIYPGETIALMGKVGSGKTTLVNLIPHLYEVNNGMLLLDDTDINDIPINLLRRYVGFVSQETFLFSDTIRRNLIYGIPEFSDEPLMENAVKISNLYNEIDQFPHKLDTILGERGVNLSGGQKQRLSLSRAIIINPAILILDDCFSNMDTETEKLIMERLNNVMKDKTTIIISHRPSTMRRAKRIVVLNEGEIAETGTHQELLDKKGLYSELYQLESLKEELENKL